MKIYHVEIPIEFIGPIIERRKSVHVWPMRVQPRRMNEDGGILYFAGASGGDYSVALEDLRCPYGERGAVVYFYSPGNDQYFFDGKILTVSVIQVSEYYRFGSLDGEEADIWWQSVYGDGLFDDRFNPWCWCIRWQ